MSVIEDEMFLAVNTAIEAGAIILDIYNTEFSVEFKQDESPLTQADRAADEYITQKLISTNIPILSEEGSQIDFKDRSEWIKYWLVDPLDGTKEFVKRNGEFTVNIALMEFGYPVAGVIYSPVLKKLYFSTEEHGSYVIEEVITGFSSWEKLQDSGKKLPRSRGDNSHKVVASRSHMSEETKSFIDGLGKTHNQVELVSMGSSLKICLVADGSADVYPRFAPTMEWDTAAGQAIAEGAGKSLIDHSTGERMRYNKESLLNNWFIVQ